MLIVADECDAALSDIIICGRQKNALSAPPHKNVRVLIPGTCKYVTFHGKGKLKLQIEDC